MKNENENFLFLQYLILVSVSVSVLVFVFDSDCNSFRGRSGSLFSPRSRSFSWLTELVSLTH